VLNSTLHHPLIHTIRFARFGNARDDSERYARGFGLNARTQRKRARESSRPLLVPVARPEP